MAAVRAIRRRELFRVAGGRRARAARRRRRRPRRCPTSPRAASTAALADRRARAVEARRGAQSCRPGSPSSAMGRFGGGELGYGSDADVLFVHDPLPGADEGEAARRGAAPWPTSCAGCSRCPAPDPPLRHRRRPAPRGPQRARWCARWRRTRAYYERWSLAWEAQALLRAEPVAGDAALGAALPRAHRPAALPRGRAHADAVREIRRIKARVEAERLPRGADPDAAHQARPRRARRRRVDGAAAAAAARARPAGPADHPHPAGAGGRTAAGLHRSESTPRELAAAWRLATQVRNAYLLVTGRAGDSLPKDLGELAAVARVLDRPAEEPPATLLEEYLRVTRRARAVTERLFFGDVGGGGALG